MKRITEEYNRNINKLKTTKKALLVGINYKGSQYELSGCINDTNNIKNIYFKLNFTN